ncbi:MAG: hypothetical protein HY302_06810 [Opitutae bacterium]|nr:hypothetical protein [Opitutae bacterium]
MKTAPASFVPRPARPGRGRRGMTILEVLIAAVLLTFVVLGALAAVSRALNLTNHARMLTLASQVLQSKVEDLRLKNYAQIAAYAAQTQPVDFTSGITENLLNSNFTSTMTMAATFTTTYASSATQVGLTSVVVTLSWTEGSSTYSRSSRTYFCEKGLSDYIYVGF